MSLNLVCLMTHPYVEVSNKTAVKVYVHATPSSTVTGGGSGGRSESYGNAMQPSTYKYFFNIGSPDTFERKLEDAQELMVRRRRSKLDDPGGLGKRVWFFQSLNLNW